MNYLELAQTLRRKCRVTGSGPIAVTGQAEEYMRLLSFINEAWLEIQRTKPDWLFMRATATCPTVAGRTKYTSTHFGLTDLGDWALDFTANDTFRVYSNPQVSFDVPGSRVLLTGHGLVDGDTAVLATTGSLPTGITAGTSYYVVNADDDALQLASTAGGAAITLAGSDSGTATLSSNNTTSFVGLRSETFLQVWDYDYWRDAYQFGGLRSSYSRPLGIAKTPDNGLACGPITAAGYTLLGDYYRVPSEMVDATDEPALPEQYHWAIIYKAMMYFGVSEAAPEIYDEGNASYDRIIRQVLATQLRRATMPGALA